MENKEIREVEIFSSGCHNGDAYSEADLDEIAANAGKVGFAPVLKDGHCQDTPGKPALGRIRNVRRRGTKLVADFYDVHPLVYEAIKNRRYDTVSSEIYWNLKNQKGTFRRALKAVALLGADIPAVADLKPLREVVFENVEVRRHEFALPYETEMERERRIVMLEQEELELQEKQYTAGITLDSRIKVFMTQHPQFDYSMAMHYILEDDVELKRAYAGVPTAREESSRVLMPTNDRSPLQDAQDLFKSIDRDLAIAARLQAEAGVEVDRRVQAMLAKNSALSYIEAMGMVLADDEKLKYRYSGGTRGVER